MRVEDELQLADFFAVWDRFVDQAVVIAKKRAELEGVTDHDIDENRISIQNGYFVCNFYDYNTDDDLQYIIEDAWFFDPSYLEAMKRQIEEREREKKIREERVAKKRKQYQEEQERTLYEKLRDKYEPETVWNLT